MIDTPSVLLCLYTSTSSLPYLLMTSLCHRKLRSIFIKPSSFMYLFNQLTGITYQRHTIRRRIVFWLRNDQRSCDSLFLLKSWACVTNDVTSCTSLVLQLQNKIAHPSPRTYFSSLKSPPTLSLDIYLPLPLPYTFWYQMVFVLHRECIRRGYM